MVIPPDTTVTKPSHLLPLPLIKMYGLIYIHGSLVASILVPNLSRTLRKGSRLLFIFFLTSGPESQRPSDGSRLK